MIKAGLGQSNSFDFSREKNLRIKPQTSIRSSIARSLKIFPKGQWDKDLHIQLLKKLPNKWNQTSAKVVC
jgi:hypothetical protein